MEINRLKHSVGSSLYLIGLFVAIMVAFELTVFQFPFSINGVRIEIVGFPWLTEQVADSTGIWRMPGYSQQFPNVYFFNYGEMLVVSIVLFMMGKKFKQHMEKLHGGIPVISKAGFIGTIFSVFVLLYFWIRMTVLWNTYIVGNTVYYPATTPPPTIQWLHQFNVPLSATLKPYIGGLVFHITTSTVSPTVGVGLDAPLYIAALLLFISIIVWKYFG